MKIGDKLYYVSETYERETRMLDGREWVSRSPNLVGSIEEHEIIGIVSITVLGHSDEYTTSTQYVLEDTDEDTNWLYNVHVCDSELDNKHDPWFATRSAAEQYLKED